MRRTVIAIVLLLMCGCSAEVSRQRERAALLGYASILDPDIKKALGLELRPGVNLAEVVAREAAVLREELSRSRFRSRDEEADFKWSFWAKNPALAEAMTPGSRRLIDKVVSK